MILLMEMSTVRSVWPVGGWGGRGGDEGSIMAGWKETDEFGGIRWEILDSGMAGGHTGNGQSGIEWW
jgi:hypothetical protein